MYEEFLIVSTPYFPSPRLYFNIDQLEEGWWDTINNRVDLTKIPLGL
ncbi:MAG: hypothetical protein HN443_01055 [Flavobacteriaceae bacterium]|jgi:hypothetical protein|nr:hypothetical protein [Flavobacteriaceae bacterium]